MIKQKVIIPFCLLVILCNFSLYSQVKIIYDTDFDSDIDDVGALYMLHTLARQDKAEILATILSSTHFWSPFALDAVNTYWGHPDIPIGARKDTIHYLESNYNKVIADKFPHTLNHQLVPDAVVLYRKILAESADESLVIVTVGPLKNIANLLESAGDSISPLSGEELVEQKVREFVIMGGQFPEGKWEWNFAGGMPGVTQNVLSRLKVPITFSGFELGVAIKSGEAFNRIDPNTPLYVGFLYFSAHAPWKKANFKGAILDNSTFDQTAVLYAVRNGTGTYWDKVSGGICIPDEKGGNTWKKAENSKQSYLKLTMDQDEIAKLMEDMMLGEF